jgi:hypothetical protein
MTRCVAITDIAKAIRKAHLRDLSRAAGAAVRTHLAETPAKDRLDALRALAKETREQCAAVLGEASTVALFGSLAHSDPKGSATTADDIERVFGGSI